MRHRKCAYFKGVGGWAHMGHAPRLDSQASLWAERPIERVCKAKTGSRARKPATAVDAACKAPSLWRGGNGMKSVPVAAVSIPLPDKNTIYPHPFASRVAGRTKRRLGDHFGLTNFGVNLTELAPGAISALPHHHSKQDEFVYVVKGTPILVLGEEEFALKPGDCVGFKAGDGVAHQLVNRSGKPVIYLEAGDRTEGDEASYPHDDLKARLTKGAWQLAHKDGRPY